MTMTSYIHGEIFFVAVGQAAAGVAHVYLHKVGVNNVTGMSEKDCTMWSGCECQYQNKVS